MKRKSGVSFTMYLLCVGTLFFIGIVIAINLLLFHQYSRTMWDRQLENTIGSMEVSTDQISQMLVNARVATAALLEDQSVEEYIYGNFDDTWENIRGYRIVQNRIIDTINKNSALEGIMILKDDGSVCGYHPNYLFQWKTMFSDSKSQEWINRIYNTKGILWEAPFSILNDHEIQDGELQAGNGLIIGTTKGEYYLSYSDKPRSFLAISVVNAKKILSCFDYLGSEGSSVYLVNQDGQRILGENVTQQIDIPDFRTHINFENKNGYTHCQDAENGAYDMVYYRVPLTHWYLVKTSAAEEFYNGLKEMRMYIMCVALLLLIVAVGGYALWSTKVSQSLERMSSAMQRVGNGDLSLRIEEPMTIREYETIRIQFNNMADNVQRLLAETKQMERERVTLEARAIRTQLSPHMIFNSISSIRWMATVLGVDTISEMLSALAELLRPVFKEWRLKWSIKEEIAHLEHYIVLLKLRCGDMLDIHMNIPEEMMNEQIPCFLFQPILENCFEHGIRKTDRISVEATAVYGDDDMLYITISDNGGGVDPQKLQLLKEQLKQSETDPTVNHGIGLYSVHRKLQLLCGSKSHLEIESTFNEGTVIRLCIQRIND